MTLPKWVNHLLVVNFAFVVTVASGAVWWASAVAGDIKHLKTDVARIEAAVSNSINDRYRVSDATRDLALRDARIQQLADRILELERKIK